MLIWSVRSGTLPCKCHMNWDIMFYSFFRDFLEYHFLRVCWPDLFWIRMQRRRSICLPTSLLQARWTAARQKFSVCQWFSIQWHQGKEILAMPFMSQKHLFWKNGMLFFRFLDAIEQYLHYPFFIFSWGGGAFPERSIPTCCMCSCFRNVTSIAFLLNYVRLSEDFLWLTCSCYASCDLSAIYVYLRSSVFLLETASSDM